MFSPRIHRALVSVSDKLGLADFARGLTAAGVEIFSTGGTRKHLESEGIAVRDVSEYTGFPEMMDGRLKTLHPKVHGGILCRHDNPEDMKALAEHGILTFELVVVNLYPFEATVAAEGRYEGRGHRADRHRRADVGPRGGQEPRLHHHRHRRRPVFGDPRSGRGQRLHDARVAPPPGRRGIRPHGPLRSRDRRLFRRPERPRGRFPGTVTIGLTRKMVLRYGENPHQQAALYAPARRPRRQRGRRPATPRQGAFLQQPPGPGQRPGHRPAVLRAGGGGDQTQQPVRRGRGRHAGRGPAAGHGGRSAERLRLGAGAEPHGRRRHGRGAGRAGPVRRGDRRPAFRRRGPGNPHHEAEVEGQRAADGGRRIGSVASRRLDLSAASTAAC